MWFIAGRRRAVIAIMVYVYYYIIIRMRSAKNTHGRAFYVTFVPIKTHACMYIVFFFFVFVFPISPTYITVESMSGYELAKRRDHLSPRKSDRNSRGGEVVCWRGEGQHVLPQIFANIISTTALSLSLV